VRKKRERDRQRSNGTQERNLVIEQ
jgi:hypothetical protein